MLTNLLAILITAVFILNVLQLPIMALGEYAWSFINRTKYEGLGAALFEAKHSLWWFGACDLLDAWFMWDLIMGLIIWLVTMVALATGALWYILGFLGFLFGSRFIIDKAKGE